MDQDTIIKVDHVSMKFNLSSEKVDNFKEYLIKRIKNNLKYDEFWALTDVNFEVKRGESVALIGLNGCGKSTVIDAIRMLLNEDEYVRNGISEEDFYSSVDKKERADNISVKGRFSDLSDDKKVEYITWLDKDYNAVLNIDIAKKQDRRNNYKKVIWGEKHQIAHLIGSH